MNLTQRVLERAHELGFDLANIAPAPPELPHAGELRAWLANDFHGELSYMSRHEALRISPRALFEPTQTIISVGMVYHQREDGPVARYARGLDYHDVMREKLKALGAFLQAEIGGELEQRHCVDSAPLLERDVALLAGLGWLGKSSCVINQTLGSYFLLGELCVNADLEVNTTPHPDRCGTCSRCIDACPTGAIVSPYVVDARRCISYLTIELRGAIPRELRSAIGEHLFGCDICQSVCPWNRKAPVTTHDAFAPREDLQSLSLIELLSLSVRSFRRRFKTSPLWRAGRRCMVRNACVVLGNMGDRDAVAPLRRVLFEDASPVPRGHAAWALGQLGGEAARDALDLAIRDESDAYVIEEARFARTHMT